MAKKGRPVEPVLVTDQEKRELERRASAPTLAKRDCERAEIILLRAQGVNLEREIWRDEVAEILAKIKRGREKLDKALTRLFNVKLF